MKFFWQRTAGALTLLLGMAALTGQTPAPRDLVWTPVTADYVALKRAALKMPRCPGTNAHVMYVAKSPAEMPAYDKIAFYEGPEPAAPSLLWVWLNRNDFSAERQLRVDDALILAAMDCGAAGARWKALYDKLRTLDEALPADEPDRYRYRHGFLLIVDANVATSASPAPARRADAAVDSEASKSDWTDLMPLIAGFYKMRGLEIADGDLPAGHYVEYRGRNALGHYEIVVSRSAVEASSLTGKSPEGMDEDMYGAYFSAVADSGAGGPAWKRRYDAQHDHALFGKIAGRAFRLKTQREIEKSRVDVAWIHTSIPLGSTVAQTAALLKKHGLKFQGHDPYYVSFSLGFNLACGREMSVAFRFGANGKLAEIKDSPESQTCL